MSATIRYSHLLSACIHAARESTKIIRGVVLDRSNVVEKNTSAMWDDPQTEADVRAQHFIATSLKRRFTNLRIVGEEDLEDSSNTLLQKLVDQCIDLDTSMYDDKDSALPPLLCELQEEDVTVWIDPLDGTKEYTLGVVENVTTLIGISYRGFSLAGVVAIPFRNQLIAGGMGLGLHVEGDLEIRPAYMISPQQAIAMHPYWSLYANPSSSTFASVSSPHSTFPTETLTSPLTPPSSIPSSPSPSPLTTHVSAKKPPTVVTSRSHMTPQLKALLASLNVGTVIRMGGAGNKGVKILTGIADAYVFPQTGTKRWDICAVQAVLEACGGQLTNSYGQLYGYYSDSKTAKVWVSECARAKLGTGSVEGVVEGAHMFVNENGVLGSVDKEVHSVLTLSPDAANQFARI